MNPSGRPTSYRPDLCDLAREHCLLGGAGADRTDSIDAGVPYANKRAEMWGHLKE